MSALPSIPMACPDEAAKLAEALRLQREGKGYEAIAKAIGENRDWVRHRLRRRRNGLPSPSGACLERALLRCCG